MNEIVAIAESAPLLGTIVSIVNSNNNREIRMCEIKARTDVENNRIHAEYNRQCLQLRADAEICMRAIDSEKLSGQECVEIIRDYFRNR